ncbi:MAG: type II secretion system GspH family protein [Puniceicoccales bacterium]|jgi:prepilin-type N-terminal cleavage/methylation domain-containing protein|nr:type II secretion system GspH family protein [Puniceicoccales bacterium]
MNILNIKKRNSGFTLVEILIVLVILSGIVAMLTRGTMSGRQAAKVNQTKVDMEGRIKTAVIARVALKGVVPAATDFTETNLVVGQDGLKDPFGENYTFDPDVLAKKVTIKPGPKATDLGVQNVDVDCSPYI